MDRNPSTPDPVIDVRDTSTEQPKHRAEDVLPGGYVPAYQTQLQYAAQGLGGIVLAADLIANGNGSPEDRAAAEEIVSEGRSLQRLLRAIASGALIVALAVGLAVAAPSAPAQAATVGATASVPAMEAPEPDPVPKDATHFGRGVWLDQCNGDILVAAPLFELFPSFGWAPTPNLPVQVQRYSVKRGRWMVVKTMLTNRKGIAAAVVHVGGGVLTLRVVAPETPWTLRATGTTRHVDVTGEPCDGI